MATELRLVCDGCGAVTAFVRVAVTKGGDAVRGQARKGGWDCRKPRNIDLCPQCVAGGRAQQVVNERSKFINGDAAARVAWLRVRALGWSRTRTRRERYLCPKCSDAQGGR